MKQARGVKTFFDEDLVYEDEAGGKTFRGEILVVPCVIIKSDFIICAVSVATLF